MTAREIIINLIDKDAISGKEALILFESLRPEPKPEPKLAPIDAPINIPETKPEDSPKPYIAPYNPFDPMKPYYPPYPSTSPWWPNDIWYNTTITCSNHNPNDEHTCK